jgi:hypothetical protein
VSDYKLCYVSGSFAWFTTQELSKQWGDDWNDAPYEHNAGSPYGPCWHNEPESRNNPDSRRGWKPGTKEPLEVGELCRCESCQRDWNDDGSPKWSLEKIAFEADMTAPCDGAANSPWSVEAINSGAVAWLVTSPWGSGKKLIVIPAGVPMEKFCELIELSGGTVYLPRKTGACGE